MDPRDCRKRKRNRCAADLRSPHRSSRRDSIEQSEEDGHRNQSNTAANPRIAAERTSLTSSNNQAGQSLRSETSRYVLTQNEHSSQEKVIPFDAHTPSGSSVTGTIPAQTALPVSSVTIQAFEDAVTLLKLLCFLGEDDVPELLLRRATRPRQIWNSSGEVYALSHHELGLNDSVFSLVSDGCSIDQAIEMLKTMGLITSRPGDQLGSYICLNAASRMRIIESINEPLVWKSQAMLLVCYTFPIHQYIDPL